ncbi:hypothetical protein Tdes44962_MAKER07324 [Teratosphaeria destructans]|uniref:Uncharacterized protein n=1 Tax=Teratosphaeria destructans TaxID=418781 RepID=A0A9W7SZ75_9PEZI|nr:hypothetical protein Tdes44962_MAKER07324 [Teratosphaeria destructans]
MRDMEGCISKILAAADAPTSLRTKKHALEALRICKIADAITAEPSSTVESEARKHFNGDRAIAEAMIKIVHSMDSIARKHFGNVRTGEEHILIRLKN